MPPWGSAPISTKLSSDGRDRRDQLHRGVGRRVRQGLAMVQPAGLRENLLPPTVLIEEVMVDGKRIAGDVGEGAGSAAASDAALSQVRIGPGGGQLDFHYTGVSLTNPARVGFRYRLAA
ncbi:MAG: hypothetical protein WDM96_19930 [Lacunisphaera sp.]